ncbi:MAG: hypothetical protein V4534_00235 [Myxococcota bacterium]
MHYLLLFLVISTTSLAETSATDRYLAYTRELHGQNHIGDEHLLTIIAHAEYGLVANPIVETEARVSIVHQTAFRVFEQLILEKLDPKQIGHWAKERLSAEAKEREQKRSKREDTIIPWSQKRSYQKLAIGREHACAISNKNLVCWGKDKQAYEGLSQNITPISVHAAWGNTLVLGDDFKMHLAGHYPKSVPDAQMQEVALDGSYGYFIGADGILGHFPISEECKMADRAALDKGLFVQAIDSAGCNTFCYIDADQNINCPGLTVPIELRAGVRAVKSFDQVVCAVPTGGTLPICFDWNGKIEVPQELGSIESLALFAHWHLGTCICGIDANGKLLCSGPCDDLLTKAVRDLGPVKNIQFSGLGASGCVVLKNDASIRCWGCYSDVPPETKMDENF